MKLAVCSSLLLTAACMSGGVLDGLALRNPNDTGPQIVWDPFVLPIPEIPFPNDVATRPDLTSGTGLRVNISRQATTRHERAFRALIDELDGFGTYASLSVRFDDRIDIAALHARQTDDDPSNDAVWLIDVDPRSPGFGSTIPLDFGPGPNDGGRTRFPISLRPSAHYFTNDVHEGASNLLLETANEDTDGDGQLDWREDLDDDGVLDEANTWATLLGDGGARLDSMVTEVTGSGVPESVAREYFDLLSAYELETETLIFRPRSPLAPATRHAVVLTRDVVGLESDSPIRSPFSWVHHLQQTSALAPLLEDGLLDARGIDIGEVAFAWSFTTQSIHDDIEALRAGLYGEGPFSWLAVDFPPTLTEVSQVDTPAYTSNVYTLDVDRLINLLSFQPLLDAIELRADSADWVFERFRESIDYLVFADFDAPAYIENDMAAFRVDPETGEAEVERATLHVTCAIPKERDGMRQPFPVAVYCNGTGSFRMELLVRAEPLARRGIATCGIDAYGHGIPGILGEVLAPILEPEGLQYLGEAMFRGRARDLNQDGFSDSGGDFWTANTFHTRDVVRQTVLDNLRLVRILRAFGAGTMPVDVDGDGELELAGDFDGDGVADLGGEQPYFTSGQSLGGIVSALIAPVEPAIQAAAPISGGGGLGDIAFRTSQTGVPEAAFLPVLGPVVVGVPRQSGAAVDISFDVADVVSERLVTVASLAAGAADAPAVGDRARLINLDNGEMDEARVREPAAGELPGRFSVRVAADLFDRVRLELYRASGVEPYRVIETFEREVESFYGERYDVGDSLVSLREGFGLRRQSPALRRLAAIAQTALERGDPINYARYYAEPYTSHPDGAVPTDLLLLGTVGDMNVPLHTGIALWRAAGHFPDAVDPEYGENTEDVLLDNWVVEGLVDLRRLSASACHYDGGRVLFDIDDISDGAFAADIPRLNDPRPHPECDGSTSAPGFCRDACPAQPPLRLLRELPHGTSAMRFIYTRRSGGHGFTWPNLNRSFDPAWWGINTMAHYFATGEVEDDPALGLHE